MSTKNCTHCLPGNPAGGIPREQFFHLSHAHQIEIPGYSVFETGGSYSKVQRFLIVTIEGKEPIDQAAYERVPPSNTVNDVRNIVLGSVQ